MVNWSDGTIKMTLGIGALGITAALATMSDSTLPFWIVLIFSMLPLMIFVFIKPHEYFSNKVVGYFHFFGVIWYLFAIGGTIFLCFGKIPLQEFIFYTFFMMVGIIPCVIFMWRHLDGRYDKQA